MKPVMQTRFGDEGNCLQAAIASLMELSLDEVPAFDEGSWWIALENWLRPQGLCPLLVKARTGSYIPAAGYWLCCGPGPRGFEHTVIHSNGSLVHDPHPDGGGLLEVAEILIFARIFE